VISTRASAHDPVGEVVLDLLLVEDVKPAVGSMVPVTAGGPGGRREHAAVGLVRKVAEGARASWNAIKAESVEITAVASAGGRHEGAHQRGVIVRGIELERRVAE
jgi:hypothetical protein